MTAVRIKLVGTATSWSFDQKEIRIGRRPDCDILLNAPEFKAVSDEHCILHLTADHARIENLSTSGTLVDGHKTENSELIHGSTIQLGRDGPQLRFFREVAQSVPPSIPTQVGVVPTVVGKRAHDDQHLGRSDSRNNLPEQPTTMKGDSSMLEQKVQTLQKMVTGSIVLIVVLAAILINLVQQVTAIQDSLTNMHAEAKTAVSTFMPELDQRLSTFETKVGEVEKSIGGIDGKVKQSEDRFIGRLNNELPKIIDAYVEQKLKQIDIRK